MEATSQGIAALEGRMVASNIIPRSLLRARGGRVRGFVIMPTSKSFRAFRTIKKSSPRLTRSTSRRISKSFSAKAMGDNFYFMSKDREDVIRRDDDEGVAVDDDVDESAAGSSAAVVETMNAVLEEIVDGQKYLKEMGRTNSRARPMKRRALVVSLALGALRGPIDDVENRLGSLRRTTSTSRLVRTPSSTGFARTAHLLTQLSFGSPH